MKNFLLLIIPLFIVGCLETPYKRGVAATQVAVLGMEEDDLTDEDLIAIKSDIVEFLDSNRSISTEIILTYSDKIAEKLNREPRRIKIVLAMLSSELSNESGNKRAREFIQGVKDTLSNLGY